MGAVQEYCDRVALIEKSELVTIGSPDKISQLYRQLFNGEAKPSAKEIEGKRWGDGSVTTTEITAQVTKDTITISQTFVAHVDDLSVVAGIRIKDSAGKEVAGTNTKIENVKVNPTKIGEATTIIWKMANVLSDGEYIVDPSVILADGITVADWWNDATTFTIRKDRHLPYPVDPGFTVDISVEK